MPPSGKRGLPPPTSIKSGSWALPLEPQGFGDVDDAPPPLPSRPGLKSVSLPQPPPIARFKRAQMPPSSSDEDLQTYHELDVNQMITQLPLPPLLPKLEPYEQEIYDDFIDVRPLPTSSLMDGSLEASEDEYEAKCFYKSEQDEPSPRRPLPQPPSPGIPVTPQRPPHNYHREKQKSPENVPVTTPAKPPRYQTNTKNQIADGTRMFDFTQAQLELNLNTMKTFSTMDGEKIKDEKPNIFMSHVDDVIPMSKQENDTDENAAVSDNSCSEVLKFKRKNSSFVLSAISDNLNTSKKLSLSKDIKAKHIPTTSKVPIIALPVPSAGKVCISTPPVPPSGKAPITTPLVPPASKASITTPPVPPTGKASITTLLVPPAGKASITTPLVAPTGKAPINTYTPKPARDSPNEECIYDDGQSYKPDQLYQEEWFYEDIERVDAENKLKDLEMDGSFLVRKSKRGGENHPYTLVVYFERHVYNLKMRIRNDNRVALGEEKPEEMSFTDVPTLIMHHKTNEVILVTKTDKKQSKTLLRKFPVALNNVKGS